MHAQNRAPEADTAPARVESRLRAHAFEIACAIEDVGAAVDLIARTVDWNTGGDGVDFMSEVTARDVLVWDSSGVCSCRYPCSVMPP